ncbi:MAG TPA: contractile injection system tape measure protein [Bacteroidia bacterium]|nr:contractile injection system tape measure protein [Bacteroidia bacterium]
MGTQNHIIRKLILELGLPKQDEAFNLQTRITNNYERILLRTMSDLFDRLVGEDEILELDRIEINIGKITSEDIDNVLSEKAGKLMEEKLIRIISELRHSPGQMQQINMEILNGIPISVQGYLQKRSVSRLDALAHVLEFGILPWADDQQQRPSLRTLLAEAMEEHPEQLRMMLEEMSDKPHVFRRLVLQIENAQLIYLASLLDCTFSAQLNGIIAEFTRAFRKAADLKPAENVQHKTEKQLQEFIVERTLQFFARTGTDLNTADIRRSPDVYAEAILAELLSFTRVDPILILRSEVQRTETSGTSPVKRIVSGSIESFLKKKFNFSPAVIEKFKKKKATKETTQQKKPKQNKQQLNADELLKKESTVVEEMLPEIPEVDDGIYIENAGLVILVPYLPGFFRNLGLVAGKEFVNDEAKWKGVHLLQWLAYGDEGKQETTEHDLLLNKIICGIEPSEPIPVSIQITDDQKAECTALLEAVIQNWTVLKRSSVHALRVTFLQKEGRLKCENGIWDLLIHRDSAVDILIDKLPWTISVIKFPWNKEIFFTEW